MANPDVENSGKGYAVFLIAGNEYGIDLKFLNSIINPQDFISSQHSLNIKKDSIWIDDKGNSLINLYELYDLPSPAQNTDTRIIVINIEEHTAAFYVEKVKEFISIDTKSSDLSKFISMDDEPLIKWKMKYGDRNILIPDFDKIFSSII
jgi:chemotaxis signal transduction protein